MYRNYEKMQKKDNIFTDLLFNVIHSFKHQFIEHWYEAQCKHIQV